LVLIYHFFSLLLKLAPVSVPKDIKEFFQLKFSLDEWSTLVSEMITIRQYAEPLQDPNYESVKTYLDELKQVNRWNVSSSENNASDGNNGAVMDVDT
jgi:hypothetical protein